MDQLGHDVPALAVSVDPANDTPFHAKRFLLEQHLTDRMRFILGSRTQLEPIWKAYGIQPQGNGFEHSAYVLLIDKQGRQRIGFPTTSSRPRAWPTTSASSRPSRRRSARPRLPREPRT